MAHDDEPGLKNSVLAKAEEQAPGFFKEFLIYLRESRKWWLIPIVIVLLLASALVVLSSSAIGPFIYPLF